MPSVLPDPNALWRRFVTNPVGGLSRAGLFAENKECATSLLALDEAGARLAEGRTAKLLERLGWAGIAISLPAIFAAPAVGFAVWSFSTAVAYGARRHARTDRAILADMRLLRELYLRRQADILAEFERRG